MKNILDYFTIEGAVGGSQEWFKNVVMYIGGCAAATACDCCIYLALSRGMTKLYPYDVHALTKKDYIDFSMKMKPYLKPRVNGVNKLYMFTEGFGRYLEDVGEQRIEMDELPGTRSVREAEEFVRAHIDGGCPVPWLMLRHKKARYKDFVWHWFLCYGYEESADGLRITVATYGASHTLPLRDLWDTGYEEKGGLIGLRMKEKKIPGIDMSVKERPNDIICRWNCQKRIQNPGIIRLSSEEDERTGRVCKAGEGEAVSNG